MAISGAKLEARGRSEAATKTNESSNQEEIAQVSAISIVQAEVDLNTPLVLEFNEITSLMAISSVGIIAVMVLSILVAAQAFFGSKGQELTQDHFTRG
jgi:hypothetical protein